MKLRILTRALAAAGAFLAGLGFSADSAAQSQRGLDARSKEVIDHWTPARINSAIPRDLVIDERGLGYLRGPGNSLTPHGHDIVAQAGPPGGSTDTSKPVIGARSPLDGATGVPTATTLSAVVTDTGTGVKSVTFYVQKSGGALQSFSGGVGTGNVWSVNLTGFTDGEWNWYVIAKDGVKPSPNTTQSQAWTFTVGTGGGGGGGEDTIPDAEWTGGVVQRAAGRIFFEMPANAKRTRWNGYVCSGTAISDGSTTNDRSIILTAAHCVYDDVNKVFARKVMFIPDQANTTAAGTDRTCSNDPIGCWVPNFGVVDTNWKENTFPANVHWDYAFYVVKDTGAYQAGVATVDAALDKAVTTMTATFSVSATDVGEVAHGLGYSYDVDPSFRYCTDPLESLDDHNWWLPNCGLSGGSSGGPWVQPMGPNGDGPVFSVNSWGYTNQPGMAGPKLSGTTASCVFDKARNPLTTFGNFADGSAGYLFSGSCAVTP